MRATMSATMPAGAERSTGTPPNQASQRPSRGTRNSEALAQKVTDRPMAHLARMPTTKSQFEVCG